MPDTTATESIITQRADHAPHIIRDFIQQEYPHTQDTRTAEERHIHATATRINTCILDAWADSDPYQPTTHHAQDALTQILWQAALTHPTYPLPGEDDTTQQLITHLTDTLTQHITYLDAAQLHTEATHAAHLISLWCQAPPIPND